MYTCMSLVLWFSLPVVQEFSKPNCDLYIFSSWACVCVISEKCLVGCDCLFSQLFCGLWCWSLQLLCSSFDLRSVIYKCWKEYENSSAMQKISTLQLQWSALLSKSRGVYTIEMIKGSMWNADNDCTQY